MQRNGTMAPCGFFTIGDETSSISVPSSVSNTGSCPLEVLIFAEARVPDKQDRHLSNRPASQLARQPGQRMERLAAASGSWPWFDARILRMV